MVVKFTCNIVVHTCTELLLSAINIEAFTFLKKIQESENSFLAKPSPKMHIHDALQSGRMVCLPLCLTPPPSPLFRASIFEVKNDVNLGLNLVPCCLLPWIWKDKLYSLLWLSYTMVNTFYVYIYLLSSGEEWCGHC